jgi:hypothetical protein
VKSPSLLTDKTFVAVAFVYNQNKQKSCQEKTFIFLLTAKINESLEVVILKVLYGDVSYVNMGNNRVLTIMYMATVRNFEFTSGIFNIVEIMHNHTRTSIPPNFTSIKRLFFLSSPQRLKQWKEK